MSTTEQDMLKILVEEVDGLNLAEAEGFVRRLLDVERRTVNSKDRRPSLKEIRELIEEALIEETEG